MLKLFKTMLLLTIVVIIASSQTKRENQNNATGSTSERIVNKDSLYQAILINRKEYSTGIKPYDVIIADFDGDAKMDVAVANSGASTRISIYRNTSYNDSILLGTKQNVGSSTDGANYLTAGDITGDGKIDIIAAGINMPIVIYKNVSTTGQILFSEEHNIEGYSEPSSVSVGDIDNDGMLDIVVSTFEIDHDSVFVLRNTSTTESISFDEGIRIVGGFRPTAIAIDDIDGDDKVDIAVSNYSYSYSGSLSVCRNTSISGSISFEPPMHFTTGNNSYSVKLADLNNDGKQDVVVGNGTSGDITLYKNSSSPGSIALTNKLNLPLNVSSGAVGEVDCIDLDLDGDKDIVIGAMHSNKIMTIQNSLISDVFSPSNFSIKYSFVSGATSAYQSTYRIATGDLNNNTSPDIVAVNYVSNSISVWENQTKGSQIVKLSVDSVVAKVFDTVVVPIRIELPQNRSISSIELKFNGYTGQLAFLGIDTVNSLLGSSQWIYQINSSDSSVVFATAGASEITLSGLLMRLRFSVVGSICSFANINMVSAIYDTGEDTVITNHGGVSIKPFAVYGDVDLNGDIQAFDASRILKYLIDQYSLNCQAYANADVTMNGLVTALDASIVLKHVVGTIPHLPYDSSTMGSISGAGIFAMNDQLFIPNAEIRMPIYIDETNNVLSYEHIIQYPNDEIEFTGIDWLPLMSNFIKDYSVDIQRGIIKLVAISDKPLNVNGPMFTLKFNGKNQGADSWVKLSEYRINEGAIIESNIRGNITKATSAKLFDLNIPENIELSKNYPNPFNPSTTIRIALPSRSYVKLQIFNTLGQKVSNLFEGEHDGGKFEYVWHANDQPSGVYFYRMEAASLNDPNAKYFNTKRMLLVK